MVLLSSDEILLLCETCYCFELLLMDTNIGWYCRSETDIINVVEQRIWHSMEEGQFENLPGKGKPLNLHTNPHADPAEDTLYRILNKNGFAPEWVELNKDIRSKAKEWRVSLKKAWAMKLEDDQSGWEERSDLLKTQLKQINNMASLQLRIKILLWSIVIYFLMCALLLLCRCLGTIWLFLLAVKCLDWSGRKRLITWKNNIFRYLKVGHTSMNSFLSC